MTTVAIVYHSGFGHTRVQAEAVRLGAASVPGTDVRLVAVDEYESAWEAIDAADAIIFGTPTYMAGVSAPFKSFLDATSGRWAQQLWKDKIAAGFTNSAGVNGDKLNTLQSLSLFAMQHGMVWVGLGLLPGDFDTTADLNRLGAFLGAMAHSPADAAPEIAPGPGDLATAEHLGRRVAQAAHRWAGVRELTEVAS
ncbi:flavodoxin family protein [Nocardia huaxiensis]|uniref:Flavodoxin family protein n=1 Tax=Nocardia huaxiensis TaxID=2755382 RepID=A0A7D6VD90_9NOCA|nr:flavodoxin family protein [Nocardia huaxiensis]QLY32574.1 flavodoxin family protein [Nocardia huaxiensis]UFS93698.1 flavodoxin family protein [Nocardia huaxiensis]